MGRSGGRAGDPPRWVRAELVAENSVSESLPMVLRVVIARSRKVSMNAAFQPPDRSQAGDACRLSDRHRSAPGCPLQLLSGQ